MDRKFYQDFYKEFAYPEESVFALESGFAALRVAGLEEDFDALIRRYAEDRNTDYAQLRAEMEGLSNGAGIDTRTGDLLLLIALSQPLQAHYERAGISLKIWTETVLDFRYKLMECKQLYGVWGVTAGNWFAWFLQLKRFAFGKLQFEVIPLKWSCPFVGSIDGVPMDGETKVLNIHIPNTGEPLDRASAHDSYARAKEFFKDFAKEVRQGDKILFVTRTWLLFKRHREVLKKESNLIRFMDDFQIVGEGEYPDYSLTWRVFNTTQIEDIDSLPQDTSLRRAYAGWMRRGEKTGWSVGIFVL